MKNLTRVSDLSSYFDEENKSRITLAFKNYNLLNPSDKLKEDMAKLYKVTITDIYMVIKNTHNKK